jgi:N-methylhydantoinase B
MVEDFRDRIDPITLEVVGNAFVSIADEMWAALVRAAYSNNIKERQDCSSVIQDPDGRVVTQGEHSIAVHLSSFLSTVDAIKRLHPVEGMSEGDVFVINDPYGGGPSHLIDVTFMLPVFHEGQLVAFVGNTGHWPDIGGKAPGQGAVGDAREIFQEGIRMPALRLYRAGELQRDIHELILLNVRGPAEREGDMRAHIASLKLGERRTKELCERYGVGFLLGCMSELMDYSERRIRQAIASVPEGSYTHQDFMDDDHFSDEPIPIVATLTVSHSPEPNLLVDFAGTGGPARCGINLTREGTLAAVYWVMKGMLALDIPFNAGFHHAIRVVAPEDCIVNPRPPSPVGARYETVTLVVDVLLGALGQALPHKAIAASHGAHGIGFAGRGSRYFIYYETVGGGTGGTSFKDGLDCCHNTSNLPIEAAELEFPLHVECLEFIPDSEGAGQFRGGLGVRKEWRILADSYINTHSVRHTIHPQGLFGGYEAPACRIELNAGSPDESLLSRMSTLVEVGPGDVLSVVTPGGGGLGPPEERAPERVLLDFLNGKVSLARARSVYCVAIDAETGQVDQEATRRLRSPGPEEGSRPSPGARRS